MDNSVGLLIAKELQELNKNIAELIKYYMMANGIRISDKN